MKCIYSEVLGSEPNPAAPFGLVVRAIILAEETPESLEITAADVDGLGDSDIIAAGSVLITPDANYICFENGGAFMQKGSSGGGGGGGSSVEPLQVTISDDQALQSYVMDKTWSEIDSALQIGRPVIFTSSFGGYIDHGLILYTAQEQHIVGFAQNSHIETYYATSEDGYPSYYWGD